MIEHELAPVPAGEAHHHRGQARQGETVRAAPTPGSIRRRPQLAPAIATSVIAATAWDQLASVQPDAAHEQQLRRADDACRRRRTRRRCPPTRVRRAPRMDRRTTSRRRRRRGSRSRTRPGNAPSSRGSDGRPARPPSRHRAAPVPAAPRWAPAVRVRLFFAIVVVLRVVRHVCYRHLSALARAGPSRIDHAALRLQRTAIHARPFRTGSGLDRDAMVGDAGRRRRPLRAGHGDLRDGVPATGLGGERVAGALDRAGRPRAAGVRAAAARRLCAVRRRAPAAAAGKRAAAHRGRGPAMVLDLPLSRSWRGGDEERDVAARRHSRRHRRHQPRRHPRLLDPASRRQDRRDTGASERAAHQGRRAGPLRRALQ